MADKEWLTNLANSRFRNGAWESQDPGAAFTTARQRIDDILLTLLAEAEDAASIFNLMAPPNKALRILADRPSGFIKPRSLIFLMGTSQIKIQQKGENLVCDLTITRQFQSKSMMLCEYRPESDAFGQVLWCRQGQRPSTPEQIMKQLLEDISKTSLKE